MCYTKTLVLNRITRIVCKYGRSSTHTSSIAVPRSAARHRNFTHAANAVGVAPQTVSRAVQEVEAALGSDDREALIFERDRGSKELTVTPYGENAMRQVVTILAEVEELTRILESPASGPSGVELRVACYPVHLARYGSLFAARNPTRRTTSRFDRLLAE